MNGDARDYKWWTRVSEKTDFGEERGEIVQTQNIYIFWPISARKRIRIACVG